MNLGVVVSLFFLAVHELIHAMCCPKGTVVYMYAVPLGLCAIPTQPLRKYRYLFMVIMPTIVLQSVIIRHKANRFALCSINLTLCRL